MLHSALGNWETARELNDQGLALVPNESLLLDTRRLLEHQVGDLADVGLGLIAWSEVTPCLPSSIMRLSERLDSGSGFRFLRIACWASFPQYGQFGLSNGPLRGLPGLLPQGGLPAGVCLDLLRLRRCIAPPARRWGPDQGHLLVRRSADYLQRSRHAAIGGAGDFETGDTKPKIR